MKYSEARPNADPERAARRIVEIASTVEPVQDGRLHVELINGPFCSRTRAARPNTARAWRSPSSALADDA
jgi:hypothetical protein